MSSKRSRHSDATTVKATADSVPTEHVLVIVGDDGTTRQLAIRSGTWRIGRGDDCEVRLDDPSASRLHACLTVDTTLHIEDLGSRNGVRVRGVPITAGVPHPLAVDEVMRIGNYSLIVQRRGTPASKPLPAEAFARRLADECSRASRFGWSFALAHIAVEDDRAAATQAIVTSAVRSVDVVGVHGRGEYELLLVELGFEEATAQLERILVSLAAAGTHARGAVVAFPRDGHDADALAASARAKAINPSAGDVGAPTIADPRMREIYELATRIAAGDICVLLLGETGTGKDVLAEVIHRASGRAQRPFIRINCAALPEALLETELFGHEKGAFTGAIAAKPGLLETADGGTLFLDEVGELPPAIQAKLLRVLEAREVQRIGAVRPKPIDVRFVAATNRDLEAEIARGCFRSDLYFRLNGVSIVIPPLRDRPEDLEPLVHRFIAEAAARSGRPPPVITNDALALLRGHTWPGNLRELKNAIERAVLLHTDGTITAAHLPTEKLRGSASPPERPSSPVLAPSADGDEAARIRDVLERCGGNQTRAARELGISRRTLVNRLNELGLPRPKKPI